MKDATIAEGTQVYKKFDEGFFFGRVSYEDTPFEDTKSAEMHYLVVYEDGDQEHVGLSELRRLIDASKRQLKKQKKQAKKTSKREEKKASKSKSETHEETNDVEPLEDITQTENEGFLAKDGKLYDTYADMVQANKAANEAHLKALNLDKFKPKAVKRKVSRPKVKESNEESSVEVRRSNRVRKAPPENVGMSLNELEIRERSIRRKVKRRKKAEDDTIPSLNADERDTLKELPNWIEDMERYLLDQENLSQQNFRSVMRQVERLVAGEGITYSRWEPGTYFKKGEQIDLSADFDELYEEAVNMEDEYGRDLGNGWLLRHPIKKMQNFQQYTYSQRKS